MDTQLSFNGVEREWLGADTVVETPDTERIRQLSTTLRFSKSTPDHSHQDMLDRVTEAGWRDIRFYRDLIAAKLGSDEKPARLEDWPTWSVSDLRDELAAYPPFGRLYDENSLASGPSYIHSSTGTTGDPRLIPLLPGDVESLSDVYRRFFAEMGMVADDVCAMTLAYGMPQGGWSLTRGVRAVGATVVPISTGRVTAPEKALRIIQELDVTVLLGTPSYLLHIARTAERIGVDIRTTSVRLLLMSAERAPENVRAELEERWGAKTRVWYANTDVGWLAVECDHSGNLLGEPGMHVPEEFAHLEILDSEGLPCPDGTKGEVVVTTAVRPSSPRIRFRTGDQAAQDRSACPCGSTSPRLLPISGRSDDSIRYHGVTIWPDAVEEVLRRRLEHSPEYFLEVQTNPTTQREDLSLLVEAEGEENSAKTVDALSAALSATLGVRFAIALVAPGSLAVKTNVETGKVRRSNR